MHADEDETDITLVGRLLAGQFPQWAELRLEPVASYGTHDIYRFDDHFARLPRIGWATGQAAEEARWLPRLAPNLPLALPVPLPMGHPAQGYPVRLVGVHRPGIAMVMLHGQPATPVVVAGSGGG